MKESFLRTNNHSIFHHNNNNNNTLQRLIGFTNNNIPKTITNGLDVTCFNEVTKECITDTGILK